MLRAAGKHKWKMRTEVDVKKPPRTKYNTSCRNSRKQSMNSADHSGAAVRIDAISQDWDFEGGQTGQ